MIFFFFKDPAQKNQSRYNFNTCAGFQKATAINLMEFLSRSRQQVDSMLLPLTL